MKKQTEKRVSDLLESGYSENDDLAHKIQVRASKLYRIDQEVKKIIPRSLEQWIRVANYRDGKLIIEVANAAVQLRARQLIGDVEEKLRSGLLPALQGIELRINPDLSRSPTSNSHRVSEISQNSAEMLKLIATSAPEALREALLRLAAHGKR
ncbi:DUF721 domain-containing protein [Escherichia coli]|nr:DUF721 domain-containing protein [Escherichia coli]